MKKALLLLALLPAISQAQVRISIQGEDTACIAQASSYSVEVGQSSNNYFFRDTTANSSGGNAYLALATGYGNLDITTTFSYDLWVKPTRTIIMRGESSVCSGGVSVPLANSNQNWALVPNAVSSPNMSVGLTIGTNGLMVGEHSSNILVSRLSYTAPINDWVHVAIVYRPDSLFLYLNGELVRSRVTHCPSNVKCLAAGLTGYYYGPDFKGNIDEFRLWDIPLTRAQILDIKDKKMMNQVDGLRYYASFDDGKFERTLGDLGQQDMIVNQVTPEKHLKKSSWEFGTYTGSDLDHLTLYVTDDFNYRWSTGETTQNILYTPTDVLNYLSVEAYNDHLTISDTLIITGEDCGQVILRDTVVIYDTIFVDNCEQTMGEDIRYLKFESYYSQDNAQVNVYEIQSFFEGANVALNKHTYANSTNGSLSPRAVDGSPSSRWSGNRNDVGPDSLNPHFIVVDLMQMYRIDSVILNIEGFDHWNQNFSMMVSNDSLEWFEIGSGINTTGIFTYYPEFTSNGYDTIVKTIHDTITMEIHDTIWINEPGQVTGDDLQYLRFESFYSEDSDQVNVYEIQSFFEGANIALNKHTWANSSNGSISSRAVDGSPSSRWSGNRNDVGPDSLNPHFIVVDLLQKYRIDSIILNIEGFDHWNQNFSLKISKDSVNWSEIAYGIDTTGIFTYYLGLSDKEYDTIVKTIHDTITMEIRDTIWINEPGQEVIEDLQFIRFESYYSEDWNQANVYEVESYQEGINVALNQPAFANSTNGALPQYAVDGEPFSRWSGNRDDVGPDSLNPHYLVIDLQESRRIDSIILNIEGFDHWNQSFSLKISNDSVNWSEIGYGIDTTGIFTFYPQYNRVLYDTVVTTIHDTIRTEVFETIAVYDTIPVYKTLTVTDTLVIDAVLTGIDSPGNTNTLLIYPNPARDHVFINTGDYNKMNGYQLKIINQTGAVVFETNVEEPLFEVNLSTWTGTGLYFIQVIDPGGNIIEIKKIVLH